MLCHIYPYGAYTQAFQSVNVSYVGKVYLDLSSYKIQQGVFARCLPTETFGSETHATRKRLVHYKHLYHPTWLACYIGAALWLMNEQPRSATRGRGRAGPGLRWLLGDRTVILPVTFRSIREGKISSEEIEVLALE